VLDAAIVGSAQPSSHYEIARYGTLIAWAESLGHDDINGCQYEPQQEKAADKKLPRSHFAKGVNARLQADHVRSTSRRAVHDDEATVDLASFPCVTKRATFTS